MPSHRQYVYRVEHRTAGTGPFGLMSPVRDALSARTEAQAARFPEAAEDCEGFEPGYHVCGVRTLAQVRAWFGSHRAALRAAGYVLVRYEPLRVNLRPGSSGTQVAFPRYAATPRQEWPWR